MSNYQSIREKCIDIMETDDSYSSFNEKRIIKFYNESNKDCKNAINYIFIELTGFSLSTIIKMKRLNND